MHHVKNNSRHRIDEGCNQLYTEPEDQIEVVPFGLAFLQRVEPGIQRKQIFLQWQ
jgi:hypothetical protein